MRRILAYILVLSCALAGCGRHIRQPRLAEGLIVATDTLCPVYTDDPTGKGGWKKARFRRQGRDLKRTGADHPPRRPHQAVLRDAPGREDLLGGLSHGNEVQRSLAIAVNKEDVCVIRGRP